jgi:hypothetical protein
MLQCFGLYSLEALRCVAAPVDFGMIITNFAPHDFYELEFVRKCLTGL